MELFFNYKQNQMENEVKQPELKALSKSLFDANKELLESLNRLGILSNRIFDKSKSGTDGVNVKEESFGTGIIPEFKQGVSDYYKNIGTLNFLIRELEDYV